MNYWRDRGHSSAPLCSRQNPANVAGRATTRRGSLAGPLAALDEASDHDREDRGQSEQAHLDEERRAGRGGADEPVVEGRARGRDEHRRAPDQSQDPGEPRRGSPSSDPMANAAAITHPRNAPYAVAPESWASTCSMVTPTARNLHLFRDPDRGAGCKRPPKPAPAHPAQVGQFPAAFLPVLWSVWAAV